MHDPDIQWAGDWADDEQDYIRLRQMPVYLIKTREQPMFSSYPGQVFLTDVEVLQ